MVTAAANAWPWHVRAGKEHGVGTAAEGHRSRMAWLARKMDISMAYKYKTNFSRYLFCHIEKNFRWLGS